MHDVEREAYFTESNANYGEAETSKIEEGCAAQDF